MIYCRLSDITCYRIILGRHICFADAEFRQQGFRSQFDGGEDEFDAQNDDCTVFLDNDPSEQRHDYLMTASRATPNNFPQYYNPAPFHAPMNTMPMAPDTVQVMPQMQAMNAGTAGELNIGSSSSGTSTISEFSASPDSWIADLDHSTQY